MRSTVSSMLVLCLAACAGCGGAPPPNERMASSEAAIRGAKEVGADGVPKASLYLKLSEEQVAKAKAMIADGDNERADLVLQRAQSDAELALALARENTAKLEAQKLVDQVTQLRGGKK